MSERCHIIDMIPIDIFEYIARNMSNHDDVYRLRIHVSRDAASLMATGEPKFQQMARLMWDSLEQRENTVELQSHECPISYNTQISMRLEACEPVTSYTAHQTYRLTKQDLQYLQRAPRKPHSTCNRWRRVDIINACMSKFGSVNAVCMHGKMLAQMRVLKEKQAIELQEERARIIELEISKVPEHLQDSSWMRGVRSMFLDSSFSLKDLRRCIQYVANVDIDFGDSPVLTSKRPINYHHIPAEMIRSTRVCQMEGVWPTKAPLIA